MQNRENSPVDRGTTPQPGNGMQLDLTESEREGIEPEPVEILRWEDDGGQMIIMGQKGP